LLEASRVLRRMFGPKVAGGWRRLHNEEFHNLYASPSIIKLINSRKMRRAGHVARMGEMRNVYSIFVRNPRGRKPLGRPRRRWKDNIRMYLRKVVWDGVDWIHVTQDRDQWRAVVEDGNVTSGSIKREEFLD
jgi:hypothetical protein